jgi:tRNA (guanine-N7-)-methyltransferase
MGKNKLKKFADLTTMECVFQFPFAALKTSGFPLRGRWRQDYFKNDNPIVLELGCGKGEYTVGLAERYPDRNFIGIDIKGARLWTGACQVRDRKIANAAFLRTTIDLLADFFAPGEVNEIWVTFPDPQMTKVNKRLTGTRFLSLYSRIATPGALLNLKTDSPFLYTYTRLMARHNGLDIVADTDDLYATPGLPDELRSIRTFYEQQWLDRGLSIKYLAFRLPELGAELYEPEVDIPHDTYRSFSRGYIQMPDLMNEADDAAKQ